MTEIKVNTKISPSRHPSVILGESPAVKSARIAMSGLYEAEGKIRELHAVVKDKAIIHQKRVMASMPRPAEGKHKITPALVYDEYAASHVISVGTPLSLQALKAADKTIISLGETVTRIDSAISLKVQAGKSARAEELRSYARGLDGAFQKLGSLFQSADKNASLVAAVLEGEPYLSGLTDENHALLRTIAAGVMAPDEVQARAEASAALDHLTTAVKSFVAATGEIFTGLQSPEIGAIDSIVKTGDDQ